LYGAAAGVEVPVTAEQEAAERAAAVLAERDAIQANLLEFDGSFVRRMLEGAPLTGQSKERWATASATLATLWETYLAYSAVIDRVAALGTGPRRPAKKDLPELTSLLTQGCVVLPGPPVPLERRDLAGTGRPPVTLAAAVATMRRAFTQVTEVTSAVEAVWTAVGTPLDAAVAALADCEPLAAGLGDKIETALRAAESAVASARATSNTDPLALFRDGRVDTSAADRASEQVEAVAARIAELDRLRQRANRRIDALTDGTAAARADRQEALAAWHDAAARLTAVPALPPPIAAPPVGLPGLAAGGQWSRLAAELDRAEADLAAAEAGTTGLRSAVEAALDRRDELRGLLRAYKAKAARLGAAEDPALAASYDQAHDLLWTAPCDLAAAESAVAAYQRAILATEGRR
jgi:hypothetical protein